VHYPGTHAISLECFKLKKIYILNTNKEKRGTVSEPELVHLKFTHWPLLDDFFI
jgi:hypothetical protein